MRIFSVKILSARILNNNFHPYLPVAQVLHNGPSYPTAHEELASVKFEPPDIMKEKNKKRIRIELEKN